MNQLNLMVNVPSFVDKLFNWNDFDANIHLLFCFIYRENVVGLMESLLFDYELFYNLLSGFQLDIEINIKVFNV